MTTQNRYPTGDVNTTFSCSAGTDRYALVDESGSPDTSDYIYQSTGTTTQQFSKGAHNITASAIAKVSCTAYWRNTHATNGYIGRVVIWVNGTQRSSSSRTIPAGGAWETYAYDWLTNPGTGSAWTEEQVENRAVSNNLTDLGVIHFTNAAWTMEVAQHYTTVDFTGTDDDAPAAGPSPAIFPHNNEVIF